MFKTTSTPAGTTAKTDSAAQKSAFEGATISITPDKATNSLVMYEKLIGDLTGSFSRRINIQHRIVYQVLEKEKIVKVLRMWTHYE